MNGNEKGRKKILKTRRWNSTKIRQEVKNGDTKKTTAIVQANEYRAP